LYTTRSNILAKMDSMISSLGANDTLVIYYSGHGSLVNDESGDEGSFGKDSVIIPVDYKTGVITDDTIRIYLNKTSSGNIFTFFDSCNSGTVCDLRYNILSNLYRTVLSTSKVFDPTEWQKMFKVVENATYPETNTNVLSLSGSRDTELAWETRLQDGTYVGVLTTAIVHVLQTQSPTIKVVDFVQQVKALIATWGGTQNPQLMSGKTFDENTTVEQFLLK